MNKRKVVSSVMAVLAMTTLLASSASAEVVPSTLNGRPYPVTVPARYLHWEHASFPQTDGVRLVCTTFNASGPGSVSVYFGGESRGATYLVSASPANYTYCTPNPYVRQFASWGAAVAIYQVNASSAGPVTFHAVRISALTSE